MNWLRKLLNLHPQDLTYLVDENSLIKVHEVHGCLSLTATQDILIAPGAYHPLVTGLRLSDECLMLMCDGSAIVDSEVFLSNTSMTLKGLKSQIILGFVNLGDSVFAISEGDEVARMYAAMYRPVFISGVTN